MRSSMQRKQSAETVTLSKSNSSAEVQMQTFSDGLPPPPPVGHSWKRIDRWAEDNYEELFDNISEGCTQNDVNELEHELDCTLPMEVRQSLQVHDGQERGGRPTGIIFGCMLLDCEEIVQEWKNWRIVNEEYLNNKPLVQETQMSSKAFDGAPSSSSNPPPLSQSSSNPDWREDLLARQESQPNGAIQKVYAHSAWIPLARDWGGNCLAVDLSPGPAGKWGQVILFGRDYDCKYVIARSWAALMATIADDLATTKWFVNEENSELKFRQFKDVEPSYMDILRWRADQKYGRKPPRRRSIPNGDSRATNNGSSAAARQSPYSSPSSDRSRSPQRFPSKPVAASSPRGHVSSPLARVAEENSAPIRVQISSGLRSMSASENLIDPKTPVAPDTPRDSVDAKSQLLPNNTSTSQRASLALKNKENIPTKKVEVAGLGVKLDSETQSGSDEMKTVEI